MNSAVIVFPASNCDRDAADALAKVTGKPSRMVWHGDASVPDDIDLIVLPGGFSYGDYLRTGAMAAHSPIMKDVVRRAKAGTPVLGICNGFQILCEAGLLPGVLMRNANLKFVCRPVPLVVEETQSMYTRNYAKGEAITVPVAHGEGNYFADEETLDQLEGEGRVAFRYVDNPNGSARNIAGILSENRRILGLMPHPERVCDPLTGGTDGKRLFEALL
ncbi:MAG: phosphoribosylformylglycinamidine synthase subunit PurQ [Alphaproteobacteria bacterium]|nr:phosphoribosylformylglycinamidine synthase subunit PurQ [Alphaproteobacteria bacterium]